MGAHYGSIHVKTDDREALKTALENVARERKKKFLLGPPINGWVSIYPKDSGHDAACSAALAKRFTAVVLHVMVYHDDIFAYTFFRNGELLNEYSSQPDYFEQVPPEEHDRLLAKPQLFRDLVRSDENVAEMHRLLSIKGTGDEPQFVVEQDRLERFAKLLGIENTLTSYEYLMDGEHDGIKGWKQFVHVPDQRAEKSAKKGTDAALRAEKKRVIKKGLLCIECLPPGSGRQRSFYRGEFCFDPLGGGVLVLWKKFIGTPQPPRLLYLKPPWTSDPDPVDLAFSSGAPSDLTFSRTGNWLAFNDGQLRLWDWRHRKAVAGFHFDAIPAQFSYDDKLLFCRWQHAFLVISLETGKIILSVQPEAGSTSVHALHPAGRMLANRQRQDQLGIINLDSGKLEKVLYLGTIMDWSGLAPLFGDKLKQAGLPEQEVTDWTKAFVRGSDEILNLKFSPDGRLLFCATTGGLRVLEWDKLLMAGATTSKPLLAVTPVPQASMFEHRQSENYVYDVTFDETHNRLLFCGIEGTIRFLGLNDGEAGILLEPPGKSPMTALRLSPNGEFFGCLSGPQFDDRHNTPWRFQIWNYRALTKAAGLD